MKVKGWVEVAVRSPSGAKESYVLGNNVTSDLTQWLVGRVRGDSYPDTGVPNSIYVVTSAGVVGDSTEFYSRGVSVAADKESVTAYFTVIDMQFAVNQLSTITQVGIHGANFYTLAETSYVNPNPQFVAADKVDITYNIQFTFDSNIEATWVSRLVKSMVGLVDVAGSYVADNSRSCEINYARASYWPDAETQSFVSNSAFSMMGVGDIAIAQTGGDEGIVFDDVNSSVRPTEIHLYTKETDGDLVGVGNNDLSYGSGLTSWVTGDNLNVPYKFSITPGS